MRKEVRNALEIISWGLIGFAILVLVLRLLGIIRSPELVTEALLGGLTFGFITLRSDVKEMSIRLDLLWSDFKERKRF